MQRARDSGHTEGAGYNCGVCLPNLAHALPCRAVSPCHATARWYCGTPCPAPHSTVPSPAMLCALRALVHSPRIHLLYFCQHPTSMEDAEERHDATVRANIKTYHGYEVTAMAGAFLIAFQIPADAVIFCLNTQVVSHATGNATGNVQLSNTRADMALAGGLW